MFTNVRHCQTYGISVQYLGVSTAVYGRLQHLPKTVNLVGSQDPGGNRRLRQLLITR